MTPLIDLGKCTDCGSCIAVCPEVFKANTETGLIEIVFFEAYLEDCVQEAINVCPVDCIFWEQSDPAHIGCPCGKK